MKSNRKFSICVMKGYQIIETLLNKNELILMIGKFLYVTSLLRMIKIQTQHFDVLKRDLIINVLYDLFTRCANRTNTTLMYLIYIY